MSVILQDNQLRTKNRLAKKTRRSGVVEGMSSVTITIPDFGSKTIAVTHVKLRADTLGRHPAKTYVLPALIEHGVELTDDVIVLDEQGQRIPRPAYALLRIDQLPQFKKG